MTTTRLALDTRSPLIYQQEYKKFSKEIVYKLNDDYGRFSESHYDVIKHSAYRFSQMQTSTTFTPYPSSNYTEYAYGLLFDAFNSNVIVLDFDTASKMPVSEIIDIFMLTGDVQSIDVAISSFDQYGAAKARHVFVGLNKPTNLIALYQMGIKLSCENFNRLIARRGEIVIRVSEKFKNGARVPLTDIQWEEAYTKTGANEWVKYTSEQLIAPLISADAPLSGEIRRHLSRTLRLRG